MPRRVDIKSRRVDIKHGACMNARLAARRLIRLSGYGFRLGTAVVAIARIARAARRHRPLVADPSIRSTETITVVIPARNEALRITPLLEVVCADPAINEVLVVDDESTDATATIAASFGAQVVHGAALPAGWVGKPWALQQGLQAATSYWVVTVDADVVPRPGAIATMVARMETEQWDVASAGAQFVCDSPGQQWLHPAMLTTLVMRFGPAGAITPPSPQRTMGNGQCMAMQRRAFVSIGGFELSKHNMTDDIAVVRALASRGWRTVLWDGTEALRVKMHESTREVWRNWGRSLPMPDVTSPANQAADIAVLWGAQALPWLRVLTGRVDPIDLVLFIVRLGTLGGTRRAYDKPGWAYWLSPTADLPAVARLTWGALRPGRTWKGRTYDP
jgi:dolichol-phosphate mannosyltransferase